MSDKVVPFPGITRLDTPPEQVLGYAVEAKLTECVVIGFAEDGSFYFASSSPDGPDVLWLMERARHRLMQITDALEDGDA